MATKYNLVIDQGTTYSLDLNLKDANNANLATHSGANALYTSRSQIRKHYLSTNATASFTTSLSNGQLTISLTDTQTSNIEPGRYMYDIELIDSSNSVTRIIEGIVTVTPEITRD